MVRSDGVPAIVMSESTIQDEPREWWKESFKRRVVRLCSAALVGGRLHADYMVQLGMPRERVFFGYDAVDNSYFAEGVAEIRGQRSEVGGQGSEGNAEMLKAGGEGTEDGRRKTEGGSQRSEVRRKYGLPEKYFLGSARFIEKKNLPRLLQAYARYRGKAEMLKADGPWDLVLLGDGPLKADLCRLISDLSLQGSVLLPGFMQYPDLPAYYGLASAFIHASTTEQWGLVVNEAMASSLPLLVSNRSGCAPDLVQEGVNGFTFDPYNVEDLAQLMLKISAFQPFSLSAFGEASRRIIAAWGPRGLPPA